MASRLAACLPVGVLLAVVGSLKPESFGIPALLVVAALTVVVVAVAAAAADIDPLT